MHPFDGGCSNFSVCKDYVGHLFQMHFLVPHPWRSSSSRSVVRPRNLYCSNNPEDSEFPGHSGSRVVTIKLSSWLFYDVHFKFLVSSEKAFFGEDKEYPLRVIFLVHNYQAGDKSFQMIFIYRSWKEFIFHIVCYIVS